MSLKSKVGLTAMLSMLATMGIQMPAIAPIRDGESCTECGEPMPPGKPRKCKACREKLEVPNA